MDLTAGTWMLIRLLLLTGGAAVVIGWGFVRLVRRNPERDWRAVPGIISEPLMGGWRRWLLKDAFEYSYEYDGKAFRGNQLTPLKQFRVSRLDAERIYDSGYSVGTTVIVYVNPADPARSVLDPSQEPKPACFIIVVGLLHAGAAWFAWVKYLASPP